MTRPASFIVLTFLAALALTACAGSATPALIGAYRPGVGPPIATYIPPTVDTALAYSAVLDLTVRNVSAVADAATRLAADNGGYLSHSYSWYVNGDLHVTLTLSVPSHQYDSMRSGLLRLGTLNTESVTGELVTTTGGPWEQSATFTVHLAPAPPPFDPHWPAMPDTGWRPARTFAAAFSVFATLFTFLVDAAIWLAVVAGPFVLLALVVRRLLRQARPVSPTATEEKKE